MKPFNPAREKTLSLHDDQYSYYALDSIPGLGAEKIRKLPYAMRILIENVCRAVALGKVGVDEFNRLLAWQPGTAPQGSISFFPGRILLQDFTGVPVLNDLTALRAAFSRTGGDPGRVNPVIPVDLIIDHSIQIDRYASPDALRENTRLEFIRNRERYKFLRWSSQAYNNLSIFPPSAGIVHQINLEKLASVVLTVEKEGRKVVFPDTLVGTDSHTPMINGLGVLGWGVGGIEATAAMLGEPIELPIPEVIGVHLTGSLPEGSTPTDLTLVVLQKLRNHGVVDRFIEFFGEGLDQLSLADRAMIANITPETGATALYFPVDARTIEYLRFSGRPAVLIDLIEAFCKAQYLFREPGAPDPHYSSVMHVDLGEIKPALAGPKRPQDRVPLDQMKEAFHASLTGSQSGSGFGISESDADRSVKIELNGGAVEIGHGSVVLAAITSCTNTSNPYVMLAAGLLARNAVRKGLKVPTFVKTSMAPGSKVVTEYLQKAGLLEYLEALGFHVAAYGCTTCIGNSGPLDKSISDAINDHELVAAAVLSGNRNFEGRINPHTRANYLASPPLVVAFALAGRVNIDLTREPLGNGDNDMPVYLKDIWPASQEVNDAIRKHIQPEMFAQVYSKIMDGTPEWDALESPHDVIYPWNPDSTYLQEPPLFFTREELTNRADSIRDARVLAWLGDSVTTDHISPAGSIPVQSPAGQYLIAQGVQPPDFNAYGTRRGNDRVMTRGTFANIRLKNRLVPGIEGGITRHLPEGETMSIYEAAQHYKDEGVATVVLAGKEYGSGSSRDWAAKGTLLLGIRAVLAESFERIHRSNLAGMGVLPLQFPEGMNASSLGLTGEEKINIGLDESLLKPGALIPVYAETPDGQRITFKARLRLDTDREVEYYRLGGILNTILINLDK